MIGSGEHPMFAFGLPHDLVTLAALACAVLTLLIPVLPYPSTWRIPRSTALWLTLLSACACALSLGYFYYYLQGHPRLIDATTYLFQARSLAHDSFGLAAFGPSASYRGRFVVSTKEASEVVAGIFPPGYPALLSLGVRLGHYEWVGPLLAAGLVIATYILCRLVSRHQTTALLAALFSVICLNLRYHTADTMSHGWSALLCCTALILTIKVSQTPLPLWRTSRGLLAQFLGLGLVLGSLVATRQLTGLVISVCCLGALLARGGKNRSCWTRGLPLFCIGTLAPLLLLLAQHKFITGSYFESPQSYYYERADGPPGCFRLGLGSGCHYEHADAIAMMGGQGLSLKWSILNTLHRLHWHSLDVANFEPLLLVALFGAWLIRKRKGARPLLAALILLPLAYSLFYFNGSYPGAGARFFSELIPLWHVFLALGLMRLRAARFGIFCSLLGVSIHAAYAHERLASPHFGPSPLTFSSATTQLTDLESPDIPGVVFFPSAHHFNLTAQSSSIYLAARTTRDSREQFVIEANNAQSAWQYDAKLGLTRWSHEQDAPTHIVLESEADYPALALRDLWVHPESLDHPCVSHGRALRLHRSGPRPRLTLELMAPRPGRYTVTARLVTRTQPQCRDVALGSVEIESKLIPQLFQLELNECPHATHIDLIELTPLVR